MDIVRDTFPEFVLLEVQMNISKFWLLSFIICLGLSFPAFSQSSAQDNTKKAIKDLRKKLKKNSRYQYGEFTIIFRPIKFNSCNIKYRFQTIESIGDGTASSSVTNSSPLDSYERTRITPDRVVTSRNGGESILPGRTNEELNRIVEKQRTQPFVETFFNLGDVDSDSLEILNLPGGIFLSFQIGENKELISKLPSNGKPKVLKKNDTFPVASKEKAEKLKNSFSKAIKQCQ